MRIYIAHNFSAREGMLRPIVKMFEAGGHQITSRWIFQDSHADKANCTESAVADIEDVDKAETFVIFIDQYGNNPGRGKWVEWGYAMGKGKRVILCGTDTNCIFVHLPNTEIYPTTVDLLRALCHRY